MQVGVNYPWFDFGWDFGLGPPAWRSTAAPPRWMSEIDRHLEHFADLGIDVVRWFILGDGLTYGSRFDAPQPDADAADEFRFDPPPIGAPLLDHFDELLRRFEAFNVGRARPVQLLPVFIDFHFCNPGAPVSKPDPADPVQRVPDLDWIKGGRADAIADPKKRRRFLDAALEPLLSVSQQHANVVFAWELINEPDWITNGWNPDGRSNDPIELTAMQAFLDEGVRRVRAAGFEATIGFGLIETLLASGIAADVHQFHHYPRGRRRLPPNPFDLEVPVMLGEFATASDIWPDLPRDRQDVLHRLRRAQEHGYPVALLWSFLSGDRYSSWSDAVQRDVRRFTHTESGTVT